MSAEPLIERLDPPRRAAVLMAILGLVILGLTLVACVMIGGRWVRRLARDEHGRRRSPATSRINASARCSATILPAGTRRGKRGETIVIEREERRNHGRWLNRKRRIEPDMIEYRFPKRLRLLKPRDFERVMQARASATDGLLADVRRRERPGPSAARADRFPPRRAARRPATSGSGPSARPFDSRSTTCRLATSSASPIATSTPNVARLIESLRKLSRRIDDELRRRSAR